MCEWARPASSHSSGEVIKALINRSADVSTHTPQDTKRKQPENWAGIVSALSVCDIRVPSYSSAPSGALGMKLLLLHCKEYLILCVFAA